MGIVYLLQPSELKNTNRYKVGRSLKNTLERAKDYKVDSNIIYYMACDDPVDLEKKIKKAFSDNFTLISGEEYFEGDIKKMKKVFMQVYKQNDSDDSIHEHDKNDEHDENDEKDENHLGYNNNRETLINIFDKPKPTEGRVGEEIVLFRGKIDWKSIPVIEKICALKTRHIEAIEKTILSYYDFTLNLNDMADGDTFMELYKRFVPKNESLDRFYEIVDLVICKLSAYRIKHPALSRNEHPFERNELGRLRYTMVIRGIKFSASSDHNFQKIQSVVYHRNLQSILSDFYSTYKRKINSNGIISKNNKSKDEGEGLTYERVVEICTYIHQRMPYRQITVKDCEISVGSYRFKHIIEDIRRFDNPKSNPYVSNGECILACFVLDIDMIVEDHINCELKLVFDPMLLIEYFPTCITQE